MLSSAVVAIVLATLPAPSPAPAPGRLVERVLAVVDTRPVLLSEMRAAQLVRGEEPGPVLESLIDELLMFAEASRLPQAAITEEQEDRALAALLAQHPDATDTEALRRMARRQATILAYVDFRFRPQVRITPEALQAALLARGREDVAGDATESAESRAGREAETRRILEAEDLDRRIESWVADLRKAAEVRYNAPER